MTKAEVHGNIITFFLEDGREIVCCHERGTNNSHCWSGFIDDGSYSSEMTIREMMEESYKKDLPRQCYIDYTTLESLMKYVDLINESKGLEIEFSYDYDPEYEEVEDFQ